MCFAFATANQPIYRMPLLLTCQQTEGALCEAGWAGRWLLCAEAGSHVWSCWRRSTTVLSWFWDSTGQGSHHGLQKGEKATSGNSLICWECNKRGCQRWECPQLRKMEQPDEAAAWLEMGSRLGTRSSAVLPTATVDFAIFKTFKSGSLHAGGINLMVSRSVDGDYATSLWTPTATSRLHNVLRKEGQHLICLVNSCLQMVIEEKSPIHWRGPMAP